MFLWIIAAVILAAVCIVGYYQGAVRGAFSTLGLIFATVLALPLSVVTAPILRICKVEHPVVLGFFAPLVAFLIVLIIFKVAGFAISRKIDTFYKYHDSDTRRQLFERLTQRLGVCLGIVNGTLYIILLSVVIYVVGYATTQFATTSNAPFIYRVINSLSAAVQSTGMTKAIARFNPAPPEYYLGADILADVFHTPLLQQRLSTYPPFLMLAERPEFQEIANDTTLQDKWTRQPSFTEFTAEERVKPLIKNVDLYNVVVDLAKPDLPDLKEYLTSGTSPKYSSEQILGRWKFDLVRTYKRATSLKRNLNVQERRSLWGLLKASMDEAVLTATIDKLLFLKTPGGQVEGKWERTPTGKYSLTTGKGKTEGSIEGSQLFFTFDSIPVVFRRK